MDSVFFSGIHVAGFIGGTAGLITLIAGPFLSPALRRFPLPFAPASKAQVHNVMTCLKGRSGTLVDLGSGDGRIVIAAAKNGFQAVGVECNLWLVLYSRWKAFRNGVSSSAKFVRQDLWDFNLKPYSNIVIFGTTDMMPTLEKKFKDELSKEVIIAACRFPLPTFNHIEIIGQDNDMVWKYRLVRKPVEEYRKIT